MEDGGLNAKAKTEGKYEEGTGGQGRYWGGYWRGWEQEGMTSRSAAWGRRRIRRRDTEAGDYCWIKLAHNIQGAEYSVPVSLCSGTGTTPPHYERAMGTRRPVKKK